MPSQYSQNIRLPDHYESAKSRQYERAIEEAREFVRASGLMRDRLSHCRILESAWHGGDHD